MLAVVACSPTGAATMLFSDDPESPSSDGVLYADTFGPGRARIYVYHVNGGASARKFPVVVLNQNATDAHVTIVKEGLGGPSTDYVDVGKAVAAAWMTSSVANAVTVPASTRVLLDAALDAEHASTNELVHAIIDVDVDAPVRSRSSACSPAKTLRRSPHRCHCSATMVSTIAGRFPAPTCGSPGAPTASTSARNVRLGGDVTEPDLTGTDATTGAPATLIGNYGVAYRLLLATPGLGAARRERTRRWVGRRGVLGPARSSRCRPRPVRCRRRPTRCGSPRSAAARPTSR